MTTFFMRGVIIGHSAKTFQFGLKARTKIGCLRDFLFRPRNSADVLSVKGAVPSPYDTPSVVSVGSIPFRLTAFNLSKFEINLGDFRRVLAMIPLAREKLIS